MVRVFIKSATLLVAFYVRKWIMDKKVQDRFEEIERNRFPQFFQMLERNLDLKRWGFQQTFSGIAGHFCPSVIYDSDVCRVRFLWYESDPLGTPTVLVRYGRLHAPIDHRYMTWNGQKCYCWHNPRMAFHFLDGLSPQEAVNNRYEKPLALDKISQLLLLENIAKLVNQFQHRRVCP